MITYLEKHKDDIREKCIEINVSYDKLMHCTKCWNNKSITFIHLDPNKGENGLEDDTPAKALMRVTGDGDKLTIWTADDIKDYL